MAKGKQQFTTFGKGRGFEPGMKKPPVKGPKGALRKKGQPMGKAPMPNC